MATRLDEQMIEKSANFMDRLIDGTWDKFAAATESMKDIVDVQPWTHVFLAIALWFAVVWLKDRNFIFHLAWMPWSWYVLIVLAAPIRIGSRH